MTNKIIRTNNITFSKILRRMISTLIGMLVAVATGVNLCTFVGARTPTMALDTHKDQHDTRNGFDRLDTLNMF